MKILSITKSAYPFLWTLFYQDENGNIDYKYVTLSEYMKLS